MWTPSNTITKRRQYSNLYSHCIVSSLWQINKKDGLLKWLKNEKQLEKKYIYKYSIFICQDGGVVANHHLKLCFLLQIILREQSRIIYTQGMSVFPLSLAVDVSLKCICCWEQGSIPLRVRSADGGVVNGPDNALILSRWLTTWARRCHAACFCCYCCCLLFADIKDNKSPSLALVELREKMIWK